MADEIESTQKEAVAEQNAKPAEPKLFQGLKRNYKYVIKSSALILIFWLCQFAYIYYFSLPGELERAIVLGAAFTAAILIGIALMIGPISVLFKVNYIQHSRTFGVWGVTFGIMHIVSAIVFYKITIDSYLANLNPFQNAIIFGLAAFIIYLPIYLTSTDWAMRKLGPRKWKTIQRLVYVAYLFSVLHYVKINPQLFWNASKIILMAVTFMVFVLELAAYIKTLEKKRTIGSMLYGGALILFGVILLYLAFKG